MLIHAIVAQFPVSLSIPDNLNAIRAVLEQAEAGDLVVFPEGAVSGYSSDVSFLAHIQQAELQAALANLHDEAARRRLTVWAGACVQQNGRWMNAAYGFSPSGKTQVYYKINLAMHERNVFTPGNSLPVLELETPGGTVMIGVQICRELRFPDQWSWLARRGAQIFLHLNNAVGFPQFQPVWRSILVSRAAETQRYVLSINSAAPDQICPSLAVAPDGMLMGEILSDRAEVLRVSLDLVRVADVYLTQNQADVVEVSWKD
jgi:predicted amidohydrolase